MLAEKSIARTPTIPRCTAATTTPPARLLDRHGGRYRRRPPPGLSYRRRLGGRFGQIISLGRHETVHVVQVLVDVALIALAAGNDLGYVSALLVRHAVVPVLP